ncbi:unnamed protein product, partial [Prorocentrum cordatum]
MLLDGRPAARGELAWPVSQSLPAGFSRSLFFAQAANQARLDLRPSLSRSSRLSDRGPPPLAMGNPDAGATLGHCMYAGNAGIVGPRVPRVQAALLDAQKDVEGDRLKFHEVELLPEGGRALGRFVDGRRSATRPTKGFRCLLKRRKVAGWQLKMASGHVTFMALVRREVLPIFHAAYAFVSQSCRACSVLWPAASDVRVELDQACSDSETVAGVGRISELSRRRHGAGLARQHAFERAGFLMYSKTGQ